MPKYKKRTWREHTELLEFLSNHSVKEAAVQWGLTDAAIRSWLYSLRKNIAETQTALNRIRTLQRISARVRKFTTIGTLETSEEEELTP